MHHLVVIAVNRERELIADELWAAGAVGVEDLDAHVRGAFDSADRAEAAAARLGGTIETASDDTGLDAWRDHATSHQAGPFVIRPPWLPAAPNGIDLVLDPQHSFGSGSHASTRLALELLASSVRASDSVIDVGTGSGVLAVGAALLGAAAVAVDTDPGAEAAVHANAAANDVLHRIDYRHVDARALEGRFTLGVCNMTVDLHELVGPTLRHNLAGGRLIVSGLLAGPHEQRAMQAHDMFEVLDRRHEGEWAALLLR